MTDSSTNRRRPFWPTKGEVIGLLVVLFVLGWMLWPAISIMIYGSGKPNRNNCLGQLRQVALAMKAYANDDLMNQFFPYEPDIKLSQGSNKLFADLLVAKEYIRDIKVFRCPTGDKHPIVGTSGSLTEEGRCSYSVIYTFASGVKGALKDDGGMDTPILRDAFTNHGTAGFNVFYSDGHGTWKKVVPPFPNPNNPPKVWLEPKGYPKEKLP